MKLHSRTCLAIACLLFAVMGANFKASAQSKDLSPAGVWKWTPANPDGRVVEITFTFKVQGEVLTGTIARSSGTATITNGVIKGDKITFQTAREGRNGKSTTTYIGKLSGDTIKGKMEIEAGGKNVASEWEVKRAKS